MWLIRWMRKLLCELDSHLYVQRVAFHTNIVSNMGTPEAKVEHMKCNFVGMACERCGRRKLKFIGREFETSVGERQNAYLWLSDGLYVPPSAKVSVTGGGGPKGSGKKKYKFGVIEGGKSEG